MSNNDNNYLSTSISTKNLARVIEDDGTDNFNDLEGLKDLLIELSKEYDECKEKYDLLVQSNYEKEKIIQEFIESSTLKEEGYNKHKSELYGEIEKLNDKIREYEMNLFSENLKDVEKKNRRLNKQKSLHYRKFINTDKIFKMENPIIENKSEYKKLNFVSKDPLEYNNSLIYDRNTDKIYETNQNRESDEENNYISYLIEEIYKKDQEIENIKIKFDERLKEVTERDQTYINQLLQDINQYQDILNNKQETYALKYKLSMIDATLDYQEKRKLQSQSEMLKLDNEVKNEKFLFNQEKEILKDEISALKVLLNERNEYFKDCDGIMNKNNEFVKQINSYKLSVCDKDQNIEKLERIIINLKKQVEHKDNEKKNLLIEYNDLKKEFLNLGFIQKEKQIRLEDEFRLEKIKMAKNLENEITSLKNLNENLRIELNKLKGSFNKGKESKKNSYFKNKNDKKIIISEYFDPLENTDEKCFTLKDCLSEDDTEILICDEKTNHKEKRISNQLNFIDEIKSLNSKLEEKEKINYELNDRLKYINSDIQNVLSENFQLKSLLALEQYEKENEISLNKFKMKKLKEYIQKQELILALKMIG